MSKLERSMGTSADPNLMTPRVLVGEIGSPRFAPKGQYAYIPTRRRSVNLKDEIPWSIHVPSRIV
jgi:hypothetical protein